MTTTPGQALMRRLPPVRGRMTPDAPLAGVTWFGVGGPADVLFKPADPADLATFLREKPEEIPLTVVGVGSNLLVRDGGVRGVVVRLGRAFAAVKADGETIHAGAAALSSSVARAAAAANLAGLEFLSGIPGTVGGALTMNAGAFGGDMRGVLVKARVMDPFGFCHSLNAADLDLAYRHSALPPDWVVLDAVLRGRAGEAAEIRRRMDEIRSWRETAQPLRVRTCGSTFVNPEGVRAWELIDRAGCRGLAIGGAKVSEKHCNFLLNTGDATAADIEALGEEIRRRVKDATGVELRWEIRRIGESGPGKEAPPCPG